MVKLKLVKLIFLIFTNYVNNVKSDTYYKNAMKVHYPCQDNTKIVLSIKTDQTYVNEDSSGSGTSIKSKVNIYYYLWVNEHLDNGTEIIVKFDKDATVSLAGINSISNTRFKSPPDKINNVYSLEFFNVSQTQQEMIMVSGEDVPHHPPYITSLKINGIERCRRPDLEFWSSYWPVYKHLQEAPDKYCGRRKLKSSKQTPLIVDGAATSEGMWPWHVAVYRMLDGTLSYICGGTILTEYMILTAAHCVAKNGAKVNAESVGVVLGKYSLYGTDTATQNMEVFDIVVHEDYYHRYFDNDIAIIKLATAAVFNNYVQPACLWFDEIYDIIGSYNVTGTVAGWGFDRTNKLTSTLRTATLPLVSDVTCKMFKYNYYSNILDGKKFCAGHNNGTSPCNGDSGGGFMVFVGDPEARFVDTLVKPKSYPGAWYVRGVVSNTLSRTDVKICDPNGYTVFMDVAKHRDWILRHIVDR